MSTKPRFKAFTTVALMCAALATTVVATGVSAGAATTPLANLKITEANVSVKSNGATDFVAAKMLAGIAALVLGLVFVVGSRRRRTSGFGTGRPAT